MVACPQLRPLSGPGRGLRRGPPWEPERQAPFTSADLAALVEAMGVEQVAPGTRLMSEGAAAERVGIVETGAVELYRRRSGSRVVLQILQPGDVFGDVPALCRSVPAFSARALTRATLVRVDAEKFLHLLAERPAVGQRFLVSLASRLQRMQDRVLEVTQGDLRRRVAVVLLGQTGGGPGRVELSQDTLASLTGSSRQSVNRVLREFEDDGVLALGYRQVDVLDPVGLSLAAGLGTPSPT